MCSATPAGPAKLVAEMHRVSDARRKDDGTATLGQAKPVGDDVADELAGIHALGELALDVVAARHQHARQIGPRWRVHLGRDQESEVD
jgi:hypothetical protein